MTDATPEQQRQEMERLLETFATSRPMRIADHASGESEDIVPIPPECRDVILAYIRTLQSERDTLIREHGELRNLHIVLAHMQYSSHEQFLMMVGRAESLLSSIPSRSSPAV